MMHWAVYSKRDGMSKFYSDDLPGCLHFMFRQPDAASYGIRYECEPTRTQDHPMTQDELKAQYDEDLTPEEVEAKLKNDPEYNEWSRDLEAKYQQELDEHGDPRAYETESE